MEMVPSPSASKRRNAITPSLCDSPFRPIFDKPVALVRVVRGWVGGWVVVRRVLAVVIAMEMGAWR